MSIRLNCVRFEDRTAPANLTITTAYLVDGPAQSKITAPVIGQMLHVEAKWSAVNLTADQSYTVRFAANGYPLDTPAITGFTGGNFFWRMKGWYAAPGPATITVTLDPNNLIAETDETDNTFHLVIHPAAPADLPSKFRMPVGKQANVDWAINNYADVDPRPNKVADYKGGPYQYDGHDAVDAGPWGFDAQDAGIPIFAAADGQVVHVENGYFDRNTSFNSSPGNDVVLDHGNNWFTVYGHFANSTITVRNGEFVKKGQLLGLMGSSGNSTGPHLHYTPFYRGLAVETHYAPELYQDDPLPYAGDVPMFVFDAGVTNYAPDADHLERISSHTRYSTTEPGNIYVWLKTYNLRANDLLQWRWIRPNGTVHSTTGFNIPADFRFSWWYWFRPLSTFQGTPGNWQVALLVNGVEMRRVGFDIVNGGETASIRVEHNGAILIDGRTTPIAFGSVASGATAPQRTFTIQNHGSLSLTLGVPTLPPGFAFVGTFPSLVPSNGSVQFTVAMKTAAAGPRYGEIAFGTNDPDTPLFNFPVSGKVTGSPPAGTPSLQLVNPNNTALAYNSGSRPRLLAPDAIVSDSDSPHFLGGSLTVGVITGGEDGGDRIDIRHQGDGPGQVGFDGAVVRFGGVPIGGVTVGPTLHISFSSTAASPAAVQAVARALTYERTAATPTTARRVIRWSLVDDTGKLAMPQFLPVTHSGVERNPVVPAFGPLAITRGVPLVAAGPFADPHGLSRTGTVHYGDGSPVQPLAFVSDTSYKFNHVYLSSPGQYLAKVTIENHQGGWAAAQVPVSVLAPAKVTAITVDDGTAQRSRVRSLTVAFDRPLTEAGAAFQVVRDGGMSPTVQTAWNPELTRATLTFSGPFVESASLRDGRYTLGIDSKLLNDTTGGVLDGDGDGLSGGAFAGYAFHRLFGDIDGNATVNFADFLAFRSEFGSVKAGSPFDSDGDGSINFIDFLAFRSRFGTTLLP